MDSELQHNRALWTLLNHRYTGDAALRMWRREGIRWGLFGIADRWLPPVSGSVAVELGAGTAFFSAALARAGARPIAVDLNEDQLATARRCQDETGLHFTGRSKLVIKPKGYQVFPTQVEEHFAALRAKVASVGAVGAPHELFSEGIVLFVEKHAGVELDADELMEHSKGIAAYMRPSHFEIMEQGQFPLNRINKTDYVLLKEKAIQLIDTLRAQGAWDRC